MEGVSFFTMKTACYWYGQGGVPDMIKLNATVLIF